MNTENIETLILNKVKVMVKQYPDSESFFTALDEYLGNDLPMTAYQELIAKANGNTVILSGGFGRKMADMIDQGKLNATYVLFQGGLRKSDNPVVERISGKVTGISLYLDDTIYGGATYRKIKEYLKPHTSVTGCFVVYDGCPIKKEDVDSMFRYYDHFNVTPNFKF